MKSLISLFFIFLIKAKAFSQIITVTVPPLVLGTPTTLVDAPIGTAAQKVMRGMFYVPASELILINSNQIKSFGFELLYGLSPSTPASGTIKIYMQNTNASSYSLGTNWQTVGMTNVYNGVYSIPTTSLMTSTNVDFNFPASFSYSIGSALNIAYEYTANITAPSQVIYYAYWYTNSSTPITIGATGASTNLTNPILNNTFMKPLFRFGFLNTNTNLNEIYSYDHVNIYPNPAIEGKTSITNLKGQSNIKLYNTFGELIREENTLEDNFKIDLSNHLSGTYILKISNDILRPKIIKLINP